MFVCFRFYGCGLVIPEALEGLHILDLGSGSGQDCFVLSKLVGEDGHVTGVDMTEEQVHVHVICSIMFFCDVSCCVVLCCAALCCAVLRCAVLCCAVLCCAVLCCTVKVLVLCGSPSESRQLCLQM